MSFLQASVTFGSYTFPYGIRLDQRENSARLDESDVPYHPGQLTPAGIEAGKIIRLTGQIGGYGAVDSSGAYITTRDQLNAEMQLMASALASGYQHLTLGDADGRYIIAQKAKFLAQYQEATNGALCVVQIELHAPDPRWLAASATTLSFGAGGSSQSVTPPGNGLIYPRVTFNGSLVNPSLKITPYNDGGGYVQTVATIALGGADVLVMDCDPRNRANALLLNGVPRLDLLGTTGATNTIGNGAFFPYLRPGGANTMVANATSGTGTISGSWQPSWLY